MTRTRSISGPSSRVDNFYGNNKVSTELEESLQGGNRWTTTDRSISQLECWLKRYTYSILVHSVNVSTCFQLLELVFNTLACMHALEVTTIIPPRVRRVHQKPTTCTKTSMRTEAKSSQITHHGIHVCLSFVSRNQVKNASRIWMKTSLHLFYSANPPPNGNFLTPNVYNNRMLTHCKVCDSSLQSSLASHVFSPSVMTFKGYLSYGPITRSARNLSEMPMPG